MTAQHTTIVVPCFNEEQNLKDLVSEYEEKKYFEQFNLLIVENGSTDKSLQYLVNLCIPNFEFVRVEENRGYGNGLMVGISSAKTKFVGWIHADQHNLLSELVSWDLKTIRENEFIKGIRKSRPISQKIVSVGMELLCSLILGQKLREINAQPSVYPRKFLVNLKNPPLDFSLDLFFYTKAKFAGLYESRKEVLFLDRKIGSSKWNYGIHSIFIMSLQTIKASWSFRKRLN